MKKSKKIQMGIKASRGNTWVGVRPTIYKDGKFNKKASRRESKALCRNW